MWEAETIALDREMARNYGAWSPVYGPTFGDSIRNVWSAIGRMFSGDEAES